MIAANAFSPAEPGIFAPIVDVLLTHDDYYMHLADLAAYVQTQAQVNALYRQPAAWAHDCRLRRWHLAGAALPGGVGANIVRGGVMVAAGT